MTNLVNTIPEASIGGLESVLQSMAAMSANGVVQMYPSIAKRMLEEINFPGQRKIDVTRVQGHHLTISSGGWVEGHAITIAGLPDGRMWLVDGQHRVAAISQNEAPVPVTVRIVPVESEQEARHFYAGFDMKNSVRTDKQILDAVGIAHDVGLSGLMATAVFTAAPILLNNLEPGSGSAHKMQNPELYLQKNKLDAVRAWAKEAREYEEIIKSAKKGLILKMRGTGMVAVALYTLRHQPIKAYQFWNGMAENDGLRKNDPRATLINDILTRTIGTGSIRQKVQQPAIAWNAFCEGRDLKIIKCLDGAKLTLWGTPLANGRQAQGVCA